MAQSKQWVDYQARLDRVASHIFEHLDEALDLNKLAEIAALSPHHWHRVYQAMRGETVAATVKRLRLDRAATYLVQTALPVNEIAQRSGYPNQQSFTRLFKAAYGLPPAAYRAAGSHTLFTRPATLSDGVERSVRIERLPELNMVAVPHSGSYMAINQAFDRLFGWLATHGLLPADAKPFALFHDDVALVAPERLRSEAGIITTQDIAIAPPLHRITIRAGDYAVLRHKGPYADMRAAYDWLYGTWLPQSGREPAGAPGLEAYLNSPRDTAPTELLSDIYLPLA
jgi:AraC family transcriptional regulator